MDYIDDKGLVKQIIKVLGLPAKMIKSDEEVEQIKAERQQQQAQQMQMQQASQVAGDMATRAAPEMAKQGGINPEVANAIAEQMQQQ